MSENWKYYPDSKKYMISNKGKIKSLHGKKPKILKQRVDLYVNKKRVSWLISELILYVFGNKLNRSHKGNQNPRSKLTEKQVVMLRELKRLGKLNEKRDTGYVVFDINNFLKFMDIHPRTLKSILNYETWTHNLKQGSRNLKGK